MKYLVDENYDFSDEDKKMQVQKQERILKIF